jgi:hypothetical protein
MSTESVTAESHAKARTDRPAKPADIRDWGGYLVDTWSFLIDGKGHRFRGQHRRPIRWTTNGEEGVCLGMALQAPPGAEVGALCVFPNHWITALPSAVLEVIS